MHLKTQTLSEFFSLKMCNRNTNQAVIRKYNAIHNKLNIISNLLSKTDEVNMCAIELVLQSFESNSSECAEDLYSKVRICVDFA